MAMFSTTTTGESGKGEDGGLTVLAHGTRVSGTLETSGVIKIEGTIDGTVRADGQVLVARGGLVEGDIFTKEAVIGGEVRGNVVATGRIAVQPGSKIEGDLAAPRMSIEEGGEVNGQLRMTAAEPVQKATPVETKPRMAVAG